MKKLIGLLVLAFTMMSVSGCNLFKSSQTQPCTDFACECKPFDEDKVYHNIENNFTQIYDMGNKIAVVVENKYTDTGYQASGILYKKSEQVYYVISSASGSLNPLTTNLVNGQQMEYQTNGQVSIMTYDYVWHSAQLVNYYGPYDLALYSFTSSTAYSMPSIGDSDQLEIGEDIIAIGTPTFNLDLFNSFVKGVLSGVDRSVTAYSSFTSNTSQVTVINYSFAAIQFDAPINAGMEGGPIFNSKGNLVGIISYKDDGTDATMPYESISYGIGLKDVELIIDTLLTKTYVKGSMGITVSDVQNLSLEEKKLLGIPSTIYRGIFVSEVNANSAASVAGITKNSLIVQIDGKDVDSMLKLTKYLVRHQVGDQITIQIKNIVTGELATHKVTLR